ncbi:hypothetical protein TeGR_g11971 [Tetraparma gracilis]|uniref:Uncharacterized protein n=1 Tax=Tetraparma gracilis TaxID=2962635 RepID=A0ABQ6MUU4_9STRA|nr:hypothetical protein TeGR_g11971 [Tetraparma gracilis]
MPPPQQQSAPHQSSPHQSATDISRRVLCGGLAGLLAKTATAPLERLKMLSQTGEGASSLPGIVRQVLGREGVGGLWAGNGANLLRVFPAKGVVFASNDSYRQLLTSLLCEEGTAKPPPAVSFLAGGLSGMTASALTYPLDLARGRISGKAALADGSKK